MKRYCYIFQCRQELLIYIRIHIYMCCSRLHYRAGLYCTALIVLTEYSCSDFVHCIVCARVGDHCVLLLLLVGGDDVQLGLHELLLHTDYFTAEQLQFFLVMSEGASVV